MMKALLKKEMLALLRKYTANGRNGKKAVNPTGKALWFAVVFLFVFVSLLFSFYQVDAAICAPVVSAGQPGLYFALTGFAAVLFGVFGGVFTTYGSLYMPSDNDFLFSLPIPIFKILLSRCAGIYISSLFYCSLIWLPAGAAYGITAGFNIKTVIFRVVLLLLITLLCSVLSCAFGWLYALLYTKTKNKSIFTVFLTLLLIVGYYYVYIKVTNSIGEIASHIGEIGTFMNKWAYLLMILGEASAGDTVKLLIFAVITLGLSAVTLFVLSKTFMNFAFSGSKAVKHAVGKNAFAKSGVRYALLKRELFHFYSVPIWLINGGLGLILLPAAGIAAIIKKQTLLSVTDRFSDSFPAITEILPVFITVAVCLVLSMNIITPASVSMEGKGIWIINSLPVDTRDILFAKESSAVLLNIFPTVFAALALCVVTECGFFDTLLSVVACVLFVFLNSDFGLFINLKMPNLSWTNPAAVVKQGLPVMLCLFGGWAFCALMGIVGYFLCGIISAQAVLAVISAVFAVLCIVLRRFIYGKGADIFAFL